MGAYIHHIERVEFPIIFYVPWADKVGLVNVIYVKWLFKIRVFNALGNVRSFFLISPSLLSTRVMVLSDGSRWPDLFNSHLMADGPIWANFSDSKCFLTAMILFFSILLISVGRWIGAFERSLYQSGSPLL
jgi:hypothetical protein